MNVQDLSHEQIVELKQAYLTRLAEEGTFAEVLNVDYDEPSQGDLAMADEIVPDDVIFNEYEDTDFVDDDFFFGGDDYEDERDENPWDYGKHFD